MLEFEKLDSGLLVPRVIARGIYTLEHFHKGEKIDEWTAENVCTNEGLIYLLNLAFTNTQSSNNWYVGVFSNNYTPLATDTAATITGNAGEFTGYSGGARPTFSPAPATQPSPTLNNSNSKASFTFTGSATLIGAFLVSSATPAGTSGTLYSAAQFPSSKNVSNTDVILLSYAVSLASS